MTDSTPGATTGWRISSYCTSNGSCVDVWFGDHIVSVRHSQATDGPELSYTHPEWAAFTAAVKDGEFDLPPEGDRIHVDDFTMSTGLWAYVTRLATEDERSVHETMTRLMLSGIGQIAKDDLREGRTPLHERAVHIRELETALAVAFETCTENCVSPEHANPALARPIMDAWIPASDNEPNAEEASWS